MFLMVWIRMGGGLFNGQGVGQEMGGTREIKWLSPSRRQVRLHFLPISAILESGRREDGRLLGVPVWEGP